MGGDGMKKERAMEWDQINSFQLLAHFPFACTLSNCLHIAMAVPYPILRMIHEISDIPMRRRVEKAMDWPILGIHKLCIEPYEKFLNGILNNLVYDYYFDHEVEIRRMIPSELALGLDDEDNHGYFTILSEIGGLAWDKNEVCEPDKEGKQTISKVNWTMRPFQEGDWAAQIKLWRPEEINRDSLPILCEWESFFFQSHYAEIFRSFSWEGETPTFEEADNDDEHRWVPDTTIYIGQFKKNGTCDMRRFLGSEWDFKVYWNKIEFRFDGPLTYDSIQDTRG